MNANSYFEDTWLEDIRDGLAQNSVISRKKESTAERIKKSSTNHIRRDDFGRIDYTYYAARSRSLRSDSVISFFKAMMTHLKIH